MMNAIKLKVELLENLLLGGLESNDPNASLTLDYIPGSVMRGCLIELAREKGLETKNPELFKQVFFSGEALFLNAYITNEQGQRTLPTPRSFLYEKDGSTRNIFDFAIEHRTDHPYGYESLPSPYCSIAHEGQSGGVMGYAPIIDSRMHIDRRLEKVFTYHSLAAGQVFHSVVISDAADLLEGLFNILPKAGELSLMGKSRGSEYGRVALTGQQPAEWQEYSPQEEPTGGKLFVTLLADAILRDPRTGGCAHDLDSCLGTAHIAAYSRMHYIGGFNRTAGLPLPQAYAIRAGSVFVYPDSVMQKLLELAGIGLGERTIDGFGRLAVNWNTLPELNFDDRKSVLPRIMEPQPIQTESFILITEEVGQRIIMQRIREKLAERVRGTKVTNPPSNAQLSRLRNVLKSSLMLDVERDQYQISRVEDHLAHLTKDSKNQFQDARVGNETMYQWLLGLIEKPEQIWNILGIDKNADSLTIGGVRVTLDSIRNLTLLNFLDGVIRMAMKRRKAESHG